MMIRSGSNLGLQVGLIFTDNKMRYSPYVLKRTGWGRWTAGYYRLTGGYKWFAVSDWFDEELGRIEVEKLNEKLK